MRGRSWIVATSVALVLAGLSAPAHAAFPGESGKIAFIRGADISKWDIFSTSPAGLGEANLTNTSDYSELAPTWSPDGTQIAFERTGSVIGSRGDELLVMSAAGGAATNITNTPGTREFAPAWSPDGTKLAFTQAVPGPALMLSTMASDGSGRIALTEMHEFGPPSHIDQTGKSWSPDGTKIAFRDPDGYISVIGADGTDATVLTTIPGEHPSWSPDGTRIAFAGYTSGGSFPDEIYVIDADGGGQAQLTDNSVVDHSPFWSPDNTRVAFTSNRTGAPQVHTMDPDGSDVTQVTTSASLGNDWQPLPVNSYPRPKGATPLYASLVPAYEPCTAPNKTHGPPLAFPSCGNEPPGSTEPLPHASSQATVGSPDSTGAAAKFIGVVRLDVMVGNPATPADEADVNVAVSHSDVRCRNPAASVCGGGNVAGPPDYAGELRVGVSLRITDKYNTPSAGGPGAATTQDANIEVTVPCTPTDTTIGGSCDSNTSLDAVIPGSVKEGRRAIWQLGGVKVYDGGPDGDAQTPSGDTLFATQGVFIP